MEKKGQKTQLQKLPLFGQKAVEARAKR